MEEAQQKTRVLAKGQNALLPCVIERGAFTTERLFEVELPAGDQLVASAFFEHFLDGDKQRLSEDAPPFGQPIQGFVRCRVVRKIDDQVVVEVPSADIIHVPSSELKAIE